MIWRLDSIKKLPISNIEIGSSNLELLLQVILLPTRVRQLHALQVIEFPFLGQLCLWA